MLRPPTGADDLLLLDDSGGETRTALAIATSLARDADGLPLDWAQMCVTDLDAAIVNLRRLVLGERVRCDFACAAPGCGERIDVAFTIGQFLDHNSPSTPRLGRGWTVSAADETGWYRLAQEQGPASAEFRLPTPNDQLAVDGLPDAEGELTRRCVRPPAIPAQLRRRVEAAMEAIAPSLSSDLQGACPACGASFAAVFDARGYCLREMRSHAAFIYEDIDVLARRYHWPEQDILSLPHNRRTAYAELARNADVA